MFQQLLTEGHLSWDSLGEFLALAVSFEHLGGLFENSRALILGRTLDQATGKLLETGKSPSLKAGELDTRGSHFFLALYWARALADQREDPRLAELFAPLAAALEEKSAQIQDELKAVQGQSVDLGGHYIPADDLADRVMRPSVTLNALIEGFRKG